MSNWRLPIKITGPAGTMNNTFCVRVAEITPADVQPALNAAAAALKAWYGNWQIFVPSGTTVSADFAVNIEDGTDKPVTFAAITAGGAGAILAPHMAICINWKTSIRARRGRGRTFCGPLLATVNDATGTINDGNITQLKNATNTLLAASQASNGWALAVYGLVNPAPKGTPPEELAALPHVARDFTGYTINDHFAVMRSRRQ